VEDNQNSRRTRRAHTNRCKQKNMFLGYHYALRQQSKQLARERSEIQKRKDLAIAASAAFHKACSDASYINSRRHRRHGSRVENLEYSERQNISKNLDSSFLSVDEQGNIIPRCHKQHLWQHKHICI
jgi:hypothetical protein